MKKLLQATLLTLALVGAHMLGNVETALAQTIKWVDKINGNNGNDGNSETTAYASLQVALNQSTSGTPAARSIIYVKTGDYGANDLTNPNGARTAILIQNLDYLTIQAVAGHFPSVKPLAAGMVSISAVNCRHLIIDGFISDQSTAQFDHWHVFNVRNLTVRRCAFEGGQRGITFCTSLSKAVLEKNVFKNIAGLDTGDALEFLAASCSEVRIQDNYFRDNTRHIRLHAQGGNSVSDFVIRRNFMIGTTDEESVRLVGAENVVIENNIVIYAAQQGIFVDAGCRDITIRHNTFYRNRYEAIRTQMTASDIVVKNNIFYGNGTHAALAAPASPLPGEDYNLIFNTGNATETAAQPAVTAFGANSKSGCDPLFVSTIHSKENLYLRDNSPALAMGADLGVTEDIERFGRPQTRSSPPDVGAYESPLPLTNTPQIAVAPNAQHFGELRIGESSTQAITVSNIGNRDLRVTASVFTGENTGEFAIQSGDAPFTLAPGATQHILIGFTPSSLGTKSAALELVCNDPDESRFLVRLSGIGGLPGLGVQEDHAHAELPANFVLEQNYPNPFGSRAASLVAKQANPETSIRFALPQTAQAKLQIYDMCGALVTTLIAGTLTAGRHEIVWNGMNAHGQTAASGMYLYRLEVGAYSKAKQMLFVR